MSPRETGKSPHEPSTGVTTPELKVAGVNVTEYRAGIPLQGFESVASALNTFASGRTRTSRATQNNLLDALGTKADGLGVGLYLLATADIDQDRTVAEMLEEAKSVLETNGAWNRHFDYDAMGTPFFKTTVEISRLPGTEDGFLLGLNAAYVGKKVEDDLAEALGIEQGLQRKDVNVVLEPEGESADRFRIDFAPIAQRLQAVYSELNSGKSRRLKGETILAGLFAGYRGESSTRPFTLGVKDGIKVSLRLGRLGDRFNWRGGNRDEELWHQEGTVLSGALATSYSDESKLEPASIVIDIRRDSGNEYSGSPAVDPVMKARMNEIASKVAAAFSQ